MLLELQYMIPSIMRICADVDVIADASVDLAATMGQWPATVMPSMRTVGESVP